MLVCSVLSKGRETSLMQLLRNEEAATTLYNRYFDLIEEDYKCYKRAVEEKFQMEADYYKKSISRNYEKFFDASKKLDEARKQLKEYLEGR